MIQRGNQILAWVKKHIFFHGHTQLFKAKQQQDRHDIFFKKLFIVYLSVRTLQADDDTKGLKVAG